MKEKGQSNPTPDRKKALRRGLAASFATATLAFFPSSADAATFRPHPVRLVHVGTLANGDTVIQKCMTITPRPEEPPKAFCGPTQVYSASGK